MRAFVFAAFCLLATVPPPAAAVGPSTGKGPKVIEIDEAGHVRTTTGTESGRTSNQAGQHGTDAAIVLRDGNAGISICNSRYRWLPSGVSKDTVVRARAFYRDVTRNYEREQREARSRGASVGLQREIGYWNMYTKFMDSVPQSERKIVERGISPRLTWWCNAPPLIQKSKQPPTPVDR